MRARHVTTFAARAVLAASAVLMSFGPVPPSHAGAERPVEPDLPPPSLSGLHVRTHEPTGRELARAEVDLSPKGLRVREAGRHDGFEMIQDFVGGSVWLADRARRVVHRLPLVDEPDARRLAGAVASGFLSRLPCGGRDALDERRGTWRGRAVRVFSCPRSGGGGREFMDTELGLVVYRRIPGGSVDELRDVRARDFPSGHFAPTDGYRDVDKGEFFHGTPAIGVYDEAAPSG